jgi:BirA family biotin operon repressor/biotin-[acetyl-CoA-carboxylase] ligase
MVLGIGINVNMRIEQHAEIKSLATSLFNESGKSVSRIDLFVAILNSLDVFYQNLDCSDEIRNEWTSKLDTLGMDINFLIGESIIEGRAESVDEEGNLIVRKKDGELVTYSAGEITLQT